MWGRCPHMPRGPARPGPQRLMQPQIRIANPCKRNSRGQSLVETALMLPIMLMVVLNALNIGYFLFVVVNLAGATRTGAEYSIVGPGSAGATNYPAANTGGLPVTTLIYQDLTGAVWNATSATIQVCSPSVPVAGNSGTSGGSGNVRANCVLCTSLASCSSASGTTGASATFVPDPDPENSTFVLNRIDVKYSFPPLIPGTPFNLVLMGNLFNSGTGLYTFYRHIEMRAM
jgi:Flp pilus assembly protein TadG